MSNLAAQRKLVEQLRNEAAIERKKVSQVCKELISFCEAHQTSDVLVSGFTSQKENPFKEKSGCIVV
ncbi:guanine nucleotide-binding subunit gamma-1 [Brachionus plicatilis]|uniref:Guanine nucleotide-binding protein subunit gamma n=1 Tax=Brachionus plicatilis TaxID=10195 RepID=A0A3M7S709_BRAPC|nr:guanine nucleotide-binding subunit gamma-1 [Brachionus plicatilis]